MHQQRRQLLLIEQIEAVRLIFQILPRQLGEGLHQAPSLVAAHFEGAQQRPGHARRGGRALPALEVVDVRTGEASRAGQLAL